MGSGRQGSVATALAVWLVTANGFPVSTETKAERLDAVAPPEATGAASTLALPANMPGDGRRTQSVEGASTPPRQDVRTARGDNEPSAREASYRAAGDLPVDNGGSGAVITADLLRESDANRQTMTAIEAVFAPLDEDEQAGLRQAAQSVAMAAREPIAWLRPTIDGIGSALELNEFPALLTALQTASNFGDGRAYEGGNFAVASTRSPAGGSGFAAMGSIDGSQRAGAEDSDRNSLREGIRVLRAALEHPMSWFVVSLIAIAAMAVSGARRWLK